MIKSGFQRKKNIYICTHITHITDICIYNVCIKHVYIMCVYINIYVHISESLGNFEFYKEKIVEKYTENDMW